MAGGNSFTKNPQKGNYNPAFDNAEVLSAPTNTTKTISSILNGVLRPGETIDFSTPLKQPEKPQFVDYIQKEQSLFINQHEEETKQLIKDLKDKLNSLIPITEDLNQDIVNIPLKNIPEENNYQLKFLQRIETVILNFRKDKSDSTSWFDSFSHRKDKRYWNKAKKGGTQYTDSGEHAAARSAA